MFCFYLNENKLIFLNVAQQSAFGVVLYIPNDTKTVICSFKTIEKVGVKIPT